MYIEQISVFLENKPGTLLEAVTILRDAKIDIRAMCVADTTDFGILRLIVSDTDGAVAAFRARELPCSRTKVIGAELEDRPGSLYRILTVLYEQNISVEYTYAFLSPGGGKAYCAMKVNDPDSAVRALSGAGIPLLEADALSSL